MLCLRSTPAGRQDLARVATPQGTGKAWTGLAQQLARAVDQLLQRATAFERPMVRQREHGAERVRRTSNRTGPGGA